MEVIKGYVEHIVFRNEENGYTVFHLTNKDGELTCVGTFPYISEGEMLEVSGEYTNHNVYGMQLQVISHEVKEPEDLISIERYLGSGAIKGLGAALAGRIVRKFKDDTFRIIEEEPERLAEVKGISERKAREISEQVEEKKDMRKAMIYLQKYGISLALSAKIYEHYGQSVYRVMEENPYQIADHVQGVGFKTADEIASKVGIHTDSDFRIRSGIFYVLLQSVTDGHVYLPQEELLRRTMQLLEVEICDIQKYLMDLAMEKKVVLKEKEDGIRVYPAHYYYLELNTAKMLHDLNVSYDIAEDAIEKRLRQIEEDAELSLDELQRTAVKEAVRNGVLVLTGGPGTGKTTTINAMIHFFESEGMDIFLAAPTGRAAKRMTEATGCEARTIHRMLELAYAPGNDDNRMEFARNQENPLETDVIIIDEMSMVDLPLMHVLLNAVMVGTRLILVGDQDQLPSVGAGRVLKNLIKSECFSVITFTKIFRQEDIQVLTPMRKGLLGVERLNTILQQYLNPPDKSKEEKEYGDKLFRVGDKVMQIKNNYQLEWEIATKYGLVVDKGIGVFNGDIGRITSINSYTETVEVEYEEKKKVNYPFQLLDELELAYAITIHKSQGSEYPAVVIPLLQGPRQLYHRNLIYTAVTRAKKCVTLVGSDVTFQEMIRNANEQNRYTSLAECIQDF